MTCCGKNDSVTVSEIAVPSHLDLLPDYNRTLRRWREQGVKFVAEECQIERFVTCLGCDKFFHQKCKECPERCHPFLMSHREDRDCPLDKWS